MTDLPPRNRKIAMVFQSYAVFPHMTVYENIAFGLSMQESSADITKRVRAAELLHIENMLARYPSQVSGGQRQRIAVARAIAMEPRCCSWMSRSPTSMPCCGWRCAPSSSAAGRDGTTTVYVTHDQVEAMSMGDRIAVMRAGKICSWASRSTSTTGRSTNSWAASSATRP